MHSHKRFSHVYIWYYTYYNTLTIVTIVVVLSVWNGPFI